MNKLSSFNAGDKVMISTKDMAFIKQMQENHGGWKDKMTECMNGPCTLIQELGTDALIKSPSGAVFRVNPEILTKYVSIEYSSGSKVVMIGNEEEMKQLQVGHGGWSNIMRMLLDQEVEVVEVMENGDCYVCKYGMTWMINPQCFENKEKEEMKEKITLKKGDRVLISDNLERCKELHQWVSTMKMFLGKTAIVYSILSTGDVMVKMNGMLCIFNPKFLTKKSTVSEFSISVGDKVKVIKDRNKVKKLQKDHGEWIDSMKLILGEKGEVKGIYRDGDLRVQIMGNLITLNRECVTKIWAFDSSDSDSDVSDILEKMQQLTTFLSDSDEKKYNDCKEEHKKLSVAVRRGDYEQTKILLDLVGPNIVMERICPLMVAVNEGHERIVQLLLEKGAMVDYKDGNGDTALHLAAQRNKCAVCHLLIEKGANVNEQNNAKVTAIMMASVQGSMDILRCLLAVPGADLNIGDKDKDTALHLAVQYARLDSVEILLAAGADVTPLNEKRFSSFHMAVLKGNEKILEAFLKRSGPSIVDCQREDNNAAIHLAAMYNHPDCLKLLIKYKADLNIRNGKMQTALHLVVSERYLECVKILVESKAEMNIKDDSGNTPIHDGVKGHNIERWKMLGSLYGMSSNNHLMEGMQRGSDSCEDIVIYLAQHGAKLDIKNDAGQTAITSCDDNDLKVKLMSIKDDKELPTMDIIICTDLVQETSSIELLNISIAMPETYW